MTFSVCVPFDAETSVVLCGGETSCCPGNSAACVGSGEAQTVFGSLSQPAWTAGDVAQLTYNGGLPCGPGLPESSAVFTLVCSLPDATPRVADVEFNNQSCVLNATVYYVGGCPQVEVDITVSAMVVAVVAFLMVVSIFVCCCCCRRRTCAQQTARAPTTSSQQQSAYYYHPYYFPPATEGGAEGQAYPAIQYIPLYPSQLQQLQQMQQQQAVNV